MKKQITIFVLFVAMAVGLGVLFSLKEKPHKQTATPIVRYASSPPSIVNVPDAPKEVVFSYIGTKPSFPNSLPIYQFANRLYSNNEITNISKSLGFASPPTKLIYGRETRMTWNSPNSTLSLNSNGINRSWLYVLFQSTTKSSPTQTLQDLAKTFVEKAFFPDEKINLVLQEETVSPI